jgi:hypothetical protein
MVTHPGRARAFEQRLLAEHIGKRPYFQLERRDAGIPAFLFPAGAKDLVIAATSQGRAAAAPTTQLSFQPYELLRVRPEERLTAAASAQPESPLLALGTDGRWTWLQAEKLVPEGMTTGKGQVLRRNFKPVAFLPPGQISRRGGAIGVTSLGRLLNLTRVLAGEVLQTTETFGALELQTGESLLACLSMEL